MRRWSLSGLLALALTVPAACRRQAAPEKPAEQPETAAVALEKIRSLRPSEADTEETVAKRLSEMLELTEQMEKKFPEARELHEARMDALIAAGYLARMKKDPALAARGAAIASAILASDAPPGMKVSAEARMLLLTIDPVAGAATRPAAETEKSIRQFVARYAGARLPGSGGQADAAEQSLMMALTLAGLAELPDLADELEEAIVKSYPESSTAGRLGEVRSWRGKPFRAELTRLDGSKLSLPGGLPGKVVVVDFWASWCAPCVEDIPHMKQLYARYKAKGVEFVGISLDRPGQKAELSEFVQAQKMNWVHTYSGKFWDDPTARAYGVGGIPRIWVLGRDGTVASADARGMLAALIERALKAPTTQPAAEPAGKLVGRPAGSPQ